VGVGSPAKQNSEQSFSTNKLIEDTEQERLIRRQKLDMMLRSIKPTDSDSSMNGLKSNSKSLIFGEANGDNG